jgi:hypothetical protein
LAQRVGVHLDLNLLLSYLYTNRDTILDWTMRRCFKVWILYFVFYACVCINVLLLQVEYNIS